jgi:Protein of unknown function (DUF1573)
MNSNLKTVLATIATLSLFTIAMIELTGISNTALVNKYKGPEVQAQPGMDVSAQIERDKKVKTLPKTTYKFLETKKVLGKMKEGDRKKFDYTLINTGNKPLFIGNVQTSCGCTAPYFTKESIPPGDSTNITLEFNSAGKPGKISKSALVSMNADFSPYSIGFEAEVEPSK